MSGIEIKVGDRVSCPTFMFIGEEAARKEHGDDWDKKLELGHVRKLCKQDKVSVEWEDGTCFTSPRSHLTRAGLEGNVASEGALSASSGNDSTPESSDSNSGGTEVDSGSSSEDDNSSSGSSASDEQPGKYCLVLYRTSTQCNELNRFFRIRVRWQAQERCKRPQGHWQTRQRQQRQQR